MSPPADSTSEHPDAPVPQRIVLDVPPGQHERIRVDVYITRFVENATRTKVQQAIREGQVTIGGKPVKASYIVQPGDRIECVVHKPPPIELIPQDLPLEIVYEDDDLIVVDKAPGMVVHPGYGHRDGTLVNALLYHVGGSAIAADDDLDDLDDEELGLSTRGAGPRFEGDATIRPGLVHRLDKDTSGLLVVAKHDRAHVGLARQFEKRTIRREYRAIVWGVPEEEQGEVSGRLGRDPRDRKRVAVVQAPRGKLAVTHYRLLEAFRHTALLGFRLETGRTHQIRVHAESIGHPVFGDPTYGGRQVRVEPLTARWKTTYHNLLARLPRQALHAYSLGFRHPVTGEGLAFTAPPPADMQDVLDRLRADADALRATLAD